MLINEKEKLLLQKTCSVPSHLNIENSLEHWIAYTYIIDSKTVATEAAVCTMLPQGIF
jgi:hypothetical protein